MQCVRYTTYFPHSLHKATQTMVLKTIFEITDFRTYRWWAKDRFRRADDTGDGMTQGVKLWYLVFAFVLKMTEKYVRLISSQALTIEQAQYRKPDCTVCSGGLEWSLCAHTALLCSPSYLQRELKPKRRLNSTKSSHIPVNTRLCMSRSYVAPFKVKHLNVNEICFPFH